ncbi:MAG TPA: cytochrome c [Methylomirabilota bacterium]|nr:cytochrome c [Methylomirabilota bacterium]
MKRKWMLAMVAGSLSLSTGMVLAQEDVPKITPETIALYDKNCASCHGKDGKGETRMGRRAGVKDYTDAKVQAEMKDEQAFKSIKDGMTRDGKELMKPFNDKLTDQQIKEVIAHMRSFAKKE